MARKRRWKRMPPELKYLTGKSTAWPKGIPKSHKVIMLCLGGKEAYGRKFGWKSKKAEQSLKRSARKVWERFCT